MTLFGISFRKRTNCGHVILLNRSNQERIYKLVANRGIDQSLDRFLRVDLRECLRCGGIPPKGIDAAGLTGSADASVSQPNEVGCSGSITS